MTDLAKFIETIKRIVEVAVYPLGHLIDFEKITCEGQDFGIINKPTSRYYSVEIPLNFSSNIMLEELASLVDDLNAALHKRKTKASLRKNNVIVFTADSQRFFTDGPKVWP